MNFKYLVFASVVFSLSACAGNKPKNTDSEEAREKAEEIESAQNRNCIRDTGSRLNRDERECNSQPGRTITREELERTGAINVEEALKRSTPIVR